MVHERSSTYVRSVYAAGTPLIQPLQGLDNQGLVQVRFLNASHGVFLGSPSIVGPDENGTLLCSHDTFFAGKATYVLASEDAGATWKPRGWVDDQYWSTIFRVRGGWWLETAYGMAVVVLCLVEWERCSGYDGASGVANICVRGRG